MIHVDEIIAYLRENLSSYAIGGSAELQAIEDDSRLHVEDGKVIPALYVMLGDFIVTSAATNPEYPAQDYEENFSVVAVLNNTLTRTGQHPQQLIPDLRQALINQLYGQRRFDEDSHPIQYVRDTFLKMDRARYFHIFTFRLYGRIDMTDAQSFDLDNFNRYVADWNSQNENADNPLATDDIDGLYDR